MQPRFAIPSSIIAVLLFFVLLFVYTKLVGPIPFAVNSTQTTKQDAFSVTGEGISEMKPDIATISVGVQANGTTVKQAQEEINKDINNVSSAVKQAGVDAKDIQTSNYNIYPNYNYQAGPRRITGYQATTNLTIKVREIDKVNAVIDQATANGANQVGGVTFDVDDKVKAQNEAREKAVADAKSKAENAAKIAGFRLGNIINYAENFGGGYPVPLPARELKMDAGGATPTQVEPGTNEIRVTVTLSYEIQ